MMLALSHALALACLAFGVTSRAADAPKPLSVDPAQNWDGDDGPWNSFTISIGTPPQYVRTFLSTASQETWAILPQGCDGTQDPSQCQQLRGNSFNYSQSSTWDSIGVYLLYIEQNLNYSGNAEYGQDTVTLGGVGSGGPTINNTIVGATASLDFFLGIFGVHPKPTNFTSFDDPRPSYMTLLKQASMIPSLSWGYTAGAQYRYTGRLASLTIGGYDRSLFQENNVTFGFAPNNERELVVGLQGISLDPSKPNVLDQGGIYMFIDSTVSQIWLPGYVCDQFEQQFGLTYNSTYDLYFVNDTMRDGLVSSNPNVTFTLGVGTSGGPTVDITLPYAAFDKTASAPFRGMQTQERYFPIRRSSQPNTYTFGRTFLQEAYLSVDWERAVFNVSQNVWSESQPAKDIVAIEPLSDSSTYGAPGTSKKGLSGGAIAGIVVGVVVGGLALLAGLVFFYVRRRRARRRAAAELQEKGANAARRSDSSSGGATLHTGRGVIPKVELDAGLDGHSPTQYAKYEPSQADSGTLRPPSSSAAGTTASPMGTLLGPSSPSPLTPRTVAGLHEAESREREVYEMPGDVPAPAEMPETGQLGPTAKERDLAREREYNGVPPGEEQVI